MQLMQLQSQLILAGDSINHDVAAAIAIVDID